MLRTFFILGLMLSTQLVYGSGDTKLVQIIDSTVILKQDLTSYKRLDTYRVVWFETKNCQLLEHTDKRKIPKLFQGAVFINRGALRYDHDFLFREAILYSSKDRHTRLSAREFEISCARGVLDQNSTIGDLELQAGGIFHVFISK